MWTESIKIDHILLVSQLNEFGFHFTHILIFPHKKLATITNTNLGSFFNLSRKRHTWHITPKLHELDVDYH